MAEALPFDTIPAEVLRDHFTKWLVESLAQTALQSAAGTAASPAAARPPTHDLHAVPDESRQTQVTVAVAVDAPPEADANAEAALAERRPTDHAEAAVGPSERPPTVEPEPKRPKAKRRPPRRKRDGPLADAIEPPPPPQAPDKPPPKASSAPPNEPESLQRSEPATPLQPPAPPVRPQYVRIGDKSVWLTKPMLRSRGWTEAAIRDFLPGPEALKPNPRFAISGAPMPVWKPETVARAEADPEWRAWLERSLKRRQTTLEALAGTDDQEFRNRLELADQAIRDCAAPPTLLDALDHPKEPLAAGAI
ncbi:hypothetical protein [Glycomyces albidus]|uniref:Uncharacterized protein n=1 Tax=Glycomyces albidus TaxID=2656774 RepID=A0A6L5GAF0_9ACTN|nr:hypothetical protein [Glycomyces albidus]MQM26588.1 hypothetical protein [Glycomyces albidus]